MAVATLCITAEKSTSGSKTSGSFAVTSGDLIIVGIAGDSSIDRNWTVNDTQTNTYGKILDVGGVNQGSAQVWTTTATATGNMTVTTDDGGSGSHGSQIIGIYKASAAAVGITGTATALTGLPQNITFTTQAANSTLLFFLSDYNGQGEARTPNPAGAVEDLGYYGGQTMLDTGASSGTNVLIQLADSGAVGSKTVGFTYAGGAGPSGGAVALEVKSTAPQPGNPPIPVYDSAGTVVTYNNATGTTIAVPYPAVVAAGDLLVLVDAHKNYDVTLTTPASPWVAPTNNTHTNGTTAAGTADTGSMRATAFYKVADGTETGNLSVTLSAALTSGTNGGVGQARILRCTKPAGCENHAWDIATAGGGDSTTGTSWSVTCGTNPLLQKNDLVVAALGTPSDAANTITVEQVAATGITTQSITNITAASSTTTTSGDMRSRTGWALITDGPSSAAPVHTFTQTLGAVAGSTGSLVLTRVRLNANPPAPRIRGELPSMRRHFRW